MREKIKRRDSQANINYLTAFLCICLHIIMSTRLTAFMCVCFFSLRKQTYEELVNKLVETAIVLNHRKSPCEEDFIPDTEVCRASMKAMLKCPQPIDI